MHSTGAVRADVLPDRVPVLRVCQRRGPRSPGRRPRRPGARGAPPGRAGAALLAGRLRPLHRGRPARQHQQRGASGQRADGETGMLCLTLTAMKEIIFFKGLLYITNL